MDLAAHPLPEVTVFSLDHPETQDKAKFGGSPEARFRRLAKRKVEKGYKDATMVTIRCEDGSGWRTKTVIVSLDKFRDRSGESTTKTLRAWVDGTMALVDAYSDEADEVAVLRSNAPSEPRQRDHDRVGGAPRTCAAAQLHLDTISDAKSGKEHRALGGGCISEFVVVHTISVSQSMHSQSGPSHWRQIQRRCHDHMLVIPLRHK